MPVTLDQWIKEIPPITRSYFILSVLTSVLLHFDVVTPFTLYLNMRLVVENLEIWRIFTNLLYFGDFSVNFFFHMYFLVRYSRNLEESIEFLRKPGEYFFMLIMGALLLSAAAPFVQLPFMSFSLTFMITYVWSRRNEWVQINFLGLFTFSAPYFPWFMLTFSVLVGGSAIVDILGIATGHIYYYLADVYPRMTGRKLIRTPFFLKKAFGDEDAIPVEMDHEGDDPAIADDDDDDDQIGVADGTASATEDERGNIEHRE